MSAGGAAVARPLESAWERGVLERLLHALNQPLTGLQCSLEVALAAPRTAEYYTERMREGLELTERMRALVETLHEVASAAAENGERETAGDEKDAGAVAWKTVMREVVEDLRPVAETKGIRITLEDGAASAVGVEAVARAIAIKKGGRTFSTRAFRMLEAAASLADRDSTLRVEMGSAAEQKKEKRDEKENEKAWFRVTWQSKAGAAEFCRAELGLLVAQAGWESAGARWERERKEYWETITVRLPGFAEKPGSG